MPYLENYDYFVNTYGLKTAKSVDFSASPSVNLGANVNLGGAGIPRVSKTVLATGSNDDVLIQAAINAVGAAGGGVVYLPAGTYSISSAIKPVSFVHLRGESMYATILKPTAACTTAPIQDRTFTTSAPLQWFKCSDLQIDGSLQPRPSGPYHKGIDSLNWQNCELYNLYVHDCTATGIGPDNHDNTIIHHCIVKDCGTAGQTAGHNGIGLATGGMPNESFIVHDCVTINSANNGYLAEADTSTTGAQHMYMFVNNISINDNKGISNTGADNVIIEGNEVYGAGIGIRDILYVSHLSTNTIIKNNIVVASTSYGIYQNTGQNQYNIEGNIVRDGLAEGIKLAGSWGSVVNNQVHDNSRIGIAVGADAGGQAVSDVIVANNLVYNNGKTVANQDGIKLDASNANLSNIVVTGNRCFDNQSLQTFSDGVMSAVTNPTQLSSATAAFTTKDVGKAITVNGAGAGGTNLVTTIVGWGSATVAVLGTAASTTVSGATFSYGQAATQRYGIFMPSAGTMTDILIANNNVMGNASTGIRRQNTATSISIINNHGCNPDVTYSQGNVTGATSFSRKNGKLVQATLTGNITVTLPVSTTASLNDVGMPGDEITLQLTQDGTGSRTATWPANFLKAGGSLTLSTGVGAVDVIRAVSDGTNWREVARSLNIS